MHVKMLRSAVVHARLQYELKEAKNKRIFGKELSSDTYRRLIKKSIDDDKSMQRWIAQHLDNRYTHDIDKTSIESIIHALRR
jgi:hypothetical protein